MTDSSHAGTLDYDVIIAGAGLAGLTAARELRSRYPDLRILVVEAKDRVGGRTLTVPMKGSRNRTEYFDLGGQWVGLTQKHICDLMDDFGFEKYPQYTEGLRQSQIGCSTIRKYNTVLPLKSIGAFSLKEIIDLSFSLFKLESLIKKVNLQNLFAWKEAEKYDEMTLSKWSRENCWSRTTCDALDIISRTIYGVDSNRINMLHHLAYCKSAGNIHDLLEDMGNGAQAFRVKGGTQQFSKKLAETVGIDNIQLNQAVKNIEIFENTGTTEVILMSTDGKKTMKKLRCSRMILAIPPNECHKIEFTPKLPNLKKKLYESMTPGHYIKSVITYESPFWRELGLSGAIISTGRTSIAGEVLPILMAYDETTENGVPALVVFINDQYSDMTTEDRCNVVTKDLIRFIGEKAMTEFIDYKEMVWSKEPYNGGCPVGVVTTGGMEAWQAIRDPFHTVHFAGTETAFSWMGYMNGAVESGLRAAHEVLHELEKFEKVSYAYLKNTMYDSVYRPPLSPTNSYDEAISPWWRRIFFAGCVCLGILAYSKKYKLSLFARTVKPVENRLVLWTTGINWPT